MMRGTFADLVTLLTTLYRCLWLRPEPRWVIPMRRDILLHVDDWRRR